MEYDRQIKDSHIVQSFYQRVPFRKSKTGKESITLAIPYSINTEDTKYRMQLYAIFSILLLNTDLTSQKHVEGTL